MQVKASLQDLFLNQARREKMPVTVFLTNGFQLKGYVRGFDNFTVVLDSDGRQQLIYKHALSTIVPLRALNISPGAWGKEEDGCPAEEETAPLR